MKTGDVVVLVADSKRYVRTVNGATDVRAFVGGAEFRIKGDVWRQHRYPNIYLDAPTGEELDEFEAKQSAKTIAHTTKIQEKMDLAKSIRHQLSSVDWSNVDIDDVISIGNRLGIE